MTIREYVERRGRLARKVTLWSMLAVIFAFALWGTLSKGTAPATNIAVTVAILLILVPVTEYLRRTKCPRCRGDLSRIASRAMSRKPPDPSANSCPHCGVNLDESTDSPQREPVLDRIETIRKTVQARAAKVSFALYVYFPMVLYAFFVAPKMSTAQIVAIALGAVAISVPAIFINRTPCPVCGRALGMVASRITRAGSGAKCKACGTDIDAPIHNSAGNER